MTAPMVIDGPMNRDVFHAYVRHVLTPTLKPGGWLVYATCSVFRTEGEHQIDAFLQRRGASEAHLDARSPGHRVVTLSP